MLTVEQQEARKQGLGGTDVAAVMGLSPYTTPYELWLIKTGKLEQAPILPDDRIRLRNAHEETIAREYAHRNNCKLKRVNKTLYHKKYPFMLCHLDRVVIGQKKIVECKSSTGFMRALWGDAGTDQVVPHYLVQVQHQLAITGYSNCDIAALIDIDDYRIYPIQRNNEVIALIEAACDRFWNYNVKENIAPDLITVADYKMMFPQNNDTFVEADDEVIQKLTTLKKIRARIRLEEREEEDCLKNIFAFIGNTSGIKQGDKTLATWKVTKKGHRVFKLIENKT